MMRSRVPATIALAALLTSCTGGSGNPAAIAPRSPRAARNQGTQPVGGTTPDIYAHTTAADISTVAATALSRVYVPNSETNTVDVIDPKSMTIVDHFAVGRLPQHITPSWDLKTLWVDNDKGNTLTPINPATGKPGPTVPVEDPYNLYFTPDGSKAIVVAERFHRLDFRNPISWALIRSVKVPCEGVDHADFSADGKQMLVSCEFSGQVAVIDVETFRLIAIMKVGGKPIDVKLSPDGSRFFVANQGRNGVSIIDATTFKETGFVATGEGTHGLYPSRDAKRLFATNRLAGTVSVLDFTSGKLLATWTIKGSPDMGGVTADGSQLWLSGRYDKAVYVLDTTTGALIHTFKVGAGPHGLCVWPQPGRFSLGHTGAMR